MHLDEYMEKASETDDLGSDTDALRVGLLGIAGEAGSVVSEAKKHLRGGTRGERRLGEPVAEELGDLLWYVALVSRRLGLSLDEIAVQNLAKTRQMWRSEMPPLPDYDTRSPEGQKLPRHMIIKFVECDSDNPPTVRMQAVTEPRTSADSGMSSAESKFLGDPLDDNLDISDGYRYHDVIHLAHATVLGWSPVIRKFFKAKRRNTGDYDRTQDGARAIAIEEGLSAFVFNYSERQNFAPVGIGWELFRHIRSSVRGLEVESQPFIAWRSAYTQAFEVFASLRQAGGGFVECDLDRREIRFVG